MKYGVANKKGLVLYNEVSTILELAWKNGIDTLDTAIAYGNSEEVIGNIGVKSWNIITKLPVAPAEIIDIKRWTQNQIKFSLGKLGVTSLYAVMLHTTAPLSTNKADIYWNTLQELKEQGVIQKIGYSIYEPTELDNFYEKFQPDIIQSPYNILDNRLENSGWLQRLSDESVEVHARSIFLQGLLLMSKMHRPFYFKKWDNLWQKWHQWLKETNSTALEASLSFVNDEDRISKIVVGIDDVKQLQEIIDASQRENKIANTVFFSTDERLINPSKWML
jgi:aryl-alcohol dehydrogenase-like predicted oxidoreductase